MVDDLQRVSVLIDEVVRGARLPRRRQREELRRELWSHFEESGLAPEQVAAVVGRFGDTALVARSFGRVYRRDHLLFYLLKLAASLVASGGVALLIQTAANLRSGGRVVVWRLAPALAPSFPKSALISVAVALGAVAAWESLRRPFSAARVLSSAGLYVLASLAVQVLFGRGMEAFLAALVFLALGLATSRFETRPAGLLAAYLAFSIAIYAVHQQVGGAWSLPRALASAAALLAVWAASLTILSRLDRAFSGLLDPT
jgi:hypothetical protein